MKIEFYIRFHTKLGQSLWLSGNSGALGNDDPGRAILMEYLNEEFWHCSVVIKKKELRKNFHYKYYLKNEDGEFVAEWGHDREINFFGNKPEGAEMIDVWNHAGEYENVFFRTPFKKLWLKPGKSKTKTKTKTNKEFTHIFKVKAPLIKKNEVVCLSGSGEPFNNWYTGKPLLLSRDGDWWILKADLSKSIFPVAYKYGIFNMEEDRFITFENSDNRLLHAAGAKKKMVILHDGFVHLPNNTWKGAGVSIPVFSLRSNNSYGVGEFEDIKLLVDWAKPAGIKLIQILPVNDTIATNTWVDSYPYAAISAFALHPIYISLAKVAGTKNADLLFSAKNKQKQLNELPELDYEEIIKLKLVVLKSLYDVMADEWIESKGYRDFFNENVHWLRPYAAFCYFRDKYDTPHFDEWTTNGIYNKNEIDKLFALGSSTGKEINFYCFIQYHLHLQLKGATDYAHKKGLAIKGDIPIGISRNGSDAWVSPQQYNMSWQAGAPPDEFTAIGQNWGFPTYNWQKMQESGFAWWKQRLEQMSLYFDAFRIDHILGFFRIWSIPSNAVQGIMGRFVPCVPVHFVEFGNNGIWFDQQRYCRPFINDEILDDVFGDLAETIRSEYLVANDRGGYDLELRYETQLQVEEHFAGVEQIATNERIKQGLFYMISNVIFFEEEDSDMQEFHFRISMERTHSFRHLIPHVQEKLRELYINYFYRRQDDLWKKEAMYKLPQLKTATNMLVCGEDLGMVPGCVPPVLQQLGILSLEIQRMPKDTTKEFSHPNDAPYLSVISPGTHDMSTIRGWWEENPERTQLFYNTILGQRGDAPQSCESWINRAIVLQHLYAPAMWSIFQLQDILGMNDTLRRQNPNEERINNPANPKNYWKYRMHISLEELLKNKDFSKELNGYITHSGR